jgi:hypothetical protein
MGKAAGAGEKRVRLEYAGPRAIRPSVPTGVYDDDTRTQGDGRNMGSPQRRENGFSPPDAREGQVGPPWVADRFVVPTKPGNSGGGKGPEFQISARGSREPGDWR